MFVQKFSGSEVIAFTREKTATMHLDFI